MAVRVLVGILTVELWMRQNTSLKDRRRIVRSVLERIRARHNVAVADLGPADDWRRAQLAFACVGSQHYVLSKALEAVLQHVEALGEAEVLDASIEIM